MYWNIVDNIREQENVCFDWDHYWWFSFWPLYWWQAKM